VTDFPSIAALAETIDPLRSRDLKWELSSSKQDVEALELAVLLGTAFPPLTPVTAWQREALGRIASEGFRVQRGGAEHAARLAASAGDHDSPAFADNLRRAVWEGKARIALRELLPSELGGAAIETTSRELSDLADASLQVALTEAEQHVAQRFGEPRRSDGAPAEMVVVGLGKLGGHELNAGSDVDIVFFYDTDEGQSSLSLHEHFSRVARRAVATLETPSGAGLAWRVDLRLRPEGSRGPLVNSLSAAERYYETWGRLWERAALLRARPVAGNAALGEQLAREIFTPFVFRREVDPGVATALAELVQRSRAELSHYPSRDLKLGPGGIREAEFFIQSLQLIWGGREPSLRVTGSLPALSLLKSCGLVSDREAREIAAAYTLLRQLEHRVQWMSGIQTHLLPEVAVERDRLARTLGYGNAQELADELEPARARVSELFASLAPHAPRPPPRYQALLARMDGLPSEFGDAAAQAFGSADVGEHLEALVQRPDGLLGELTRERFPDLADKLLDALASSPDPNQAAHYLRAFFARFSSPGPYVAALGEDEHALKRLVTVLGASAFVGDAVVSRPDLADIILFGRGQVSDPRAAVAAEIETADREAAGERRGEVEPYEPRDRLVAGLRRAKRRVTMEVAVADLAGMIETREATLLLSDLADEELERATSFVLDSRTEGLSVIAVGKLGGRDIGYGSDLDVLFIYDGDLAPPDSDPGEHYVRRAQRIIRLISEPHLAGPGYDLDTRLRPSGSHGMLVTSLSSFARYHGVGAAARNNTGPGVLSSGAAWERQALLRARVCAGDKKLGARVIAVAEEAAYERDTPPVDDLHRLRLRMQKELAHERGGRFDLKTGRGGLLDVEFATQWLQMRHGRDRRVRTTDTAQALEALRAASYLARRDYEILSEGYRFLRRLEQRIHILHGASSSLIDTHATGLAQLARRMGFQDSNKVSAERLLVERYAQVTREVRESYKRVLGVA
jgi:glutamate-ammonia-ligase adenylyltransferase